MTASEFLVASMVGCEELSSISPIYPDGIACKMRNDMVYVVPNKIAYMGDKDGTIWAIFVYRSGLCALRSLSSCNGFLVVVSEKRDDRFVTPYCLFGCDVVRPSRLLGPGIGVFVSENGLFILEPTRIRVMNSAGSEVENILLPFRLIDDTYHRFVVFGGRAFIETSEGVIVFDIVDNSYRELEYYTKLSDDMTAVVYTKPAGQLRKLQFYDLRSLSVAAEILVPFAGITHINYSLGCVAFWSCSDVHIVDFRKNNLVILRNVGNFAANRDGYVMFNNASISKIFLCHISDILGLARNSRSVLVIDTDTVCDGRTMLAAMDAGV